METDILINKISKQQWRRNSARFAATNVKELLKGWTTEQRESASNAVKTAEELANYILELTADNTDVRRIKEFCIENHIHLEYTEESVIPTKALFEFLDELENVDPPKPLIYVAVPYSHDDESVEDYRFRLATKFTGQLMKEGLHAFSPITHSHPINRVADLPGDWDFWEHYDTAYLEYSHKLIVLTLDGWKESTGVQAEIMIAKSLGIDIEYVTEEEILSIN